MASQKFIIYGLQDPITFEIRYIGKSCSGFSRIRRHFRDSEDKYDKNKHKINWIKSLKNKGLLPNILIIQEHMNHEFLAKAEAYWIDYFFKQNCPLLNISLGGEQIRLSESTKLKISANSLKWFSNPENKKLQSDAIKKSLSTPECKKRKSDIQKERWEDSEYRKNISRKRQETWLNPEYKKKTGRSISNSKKQKIVDQYGTIYESQMMAAEILKVSRPDICIAIKHNKLINGYYLRKL